MPFFSPPMLLATDNDPYWSNVRVLLHMDGSNGGTTFTDEKGHTFTGSSIITSTTQYKSGSASAYYDGSSEDLVASSTTDFDFSGDFTVEAWVYVTSLSAGRAVVTRRDPGYAASGAWGILINTTGSVSWADTLNSGSDVTTGTGLITTNTWRHIAVTRSGTTLRIFVDGVQGASASSHSTNYTSSFNLNIGRWDSNFSYPYVGYIDEFRLTVGVARYTSTFTPQSRFPDL